MALQRAMFFASFLHSAINNEVFAEFYDVTDHNKDGYFVVPFGRFFYMWREGICAHKSNPYEQPFVVAKIKKEVQL